MCLERQVVPKIRKQRWVEIGWREWVGLPKLELPQIKAKIDTGARTSALHAIDLETFTKDGEAWVEFSVPQSGDSASRRQTSKIFAERDIKNTSGIADRRYIIVTTLQLGLRRWQIELSLADRDNMGFELILGRTALRRHGVLVVPGRSFLVAPPLCESSARSDLVTQ